MHNLRFISITAVVLAGLAGSVNAETAPPQAASTSSGSAASERVETWTKTQWDSAQKEWAKDKTKWSGCQKQSEVKHLDGRKSWSFLYSCMTS